MYVKSVNALKNRSFLGLGKSRNWLILIVRMEAVRQLFRKWRESKKQVDGCVFLIFSCLKSLIYHWNLLVWNSGFGWRPISSCLLFIQSDCQWKDLWRHSCISCFWWHPVQDKEEWVGFFSFLFLTIALLFVRWFSVAHKSSYTQDVKEGCRWRKMVREVCFEVLYYSKAWFY